MSSLLQTIDLRRVFSETGEQLEILKGVNFSMDAGELVALTGSSGSGKSTFLNLVGMLDTPTSGEIYFKGKPLSKFKGEERDMYHRVQVGFVFNGRSGADFVPATIRPEKQLEDYVHIAPEDILKSGNKKSP